MNNWWCYPLKLLQRLRSINTLADKHRAYEIKFTTSS